MEPYCRGLYEAAIRRGEGFLSESGAFITCTGPDTGRIPNDKFIVREASSERQVHWSSVNRPIEETRFEALKATCDDALAVTDERGHDLVALDEALQALASFDARKSRVIELRFFGGLTVDETAAILKVSVDTVMRDWKLAKAWLLREMRGDK